MVVRESGSALVFAAGGIDFTTALSGSDRADPRVQRIAANVIARALNRVPQLSVTFGAPPAAPSGPFARDVRTVAGLPFDAGDDDGPPGVGRLRAPGAVAVLGDGSLVVVDMDSGRLRHVAADGRLSTIACPRLLRPSGLAVDTTGTLYIADTGNACLRTIDAAGNASVLAGACGSLAAVDGPGRTARFMAPGGMAISGRTLYVADIGAGTVRKVDLASPAHTVSTVIAPPLSYPSGVSVAKDGTLYVVETGNMRVVSIQNGVERVIAGAGPGFLDGNATTARLLPQFGIALLADGSLVVSDPGNNRIRLIKNGQVSTLAGSGRYGHHGGGGGDAELVLPAGLAVDGSGNVFVSEPGSSTIREVVMP
jgi:sugar lactone lactonase YvrE